MLSSTVMTELVIPVRRRHLRQGCPGRSEKCAVALAANEWFHGLVHAHIHRSDAFFMLPDGVRVHGMISPQTGELIQAWDCANHPDFPEFDARFTLLQSDFEKLQALLISTVER